MAYVCWSIIVMDLLLLALLGDACDYYQQTPHFFLRCEVQYS